MNFHWNYLKSSSARRWRLTECFLGHSCFQPHHLCSYLSAHWFYKNSFSGRQAERDRKRCWLKSHSVPTITRTGLIPQTHICTENLLPPEANRKTDRIIRHMDSIIAIEPDPYGLALLNQVLLQHCVLLVWSVSGVWLLGLNAADALML